MARTAEAYWHCWNRACGRTLPVTQFDDEVETLHCVCGSAMRKQAQPSVFSYLDFLREEPPRDAGEGVRKE